MVPSIARQSVIIKCNMQASVLLGNYEFYYLAGLMKKIYNLDERAFKHNKKNFDLNSVEKETAIVHYNGKYKPWLNGYKGELNCFYPNIENKGPAPVGKIKKQIKSILNITKATKA